MPRPSEKHGKLEKLLGTWHGEERIFPTPWDTEGGTASARVHNQLALDGFAVVQDYEQERRGVVHFRAHGIFRWDTLTHAYELHWFDSMGTAPSLFRGTFDGDVLTLTSQHGHGFVRARWDFSAPAQYLLRDGGLRRRAAVATLHGRPLRAGGVGTDRVLGPCDRLAAIGWRRSAVGGRGLTGDS